PKPSEHENEIIPESPRSQASITTEHAEISTALTETNSVAELVVDENITETDLNTNNNAVLGANQTVSLQNNNRAVDTLYLTTIFVAILMAIILTFLLRRK